MTYPQRCLMRSHSKYNNHKIKKNGQKFDSKAEYYFYLALKQDSTVEKIIFQPCFPLIASFKKNGHTYRGISYRADFDVRYKDGTRKIYDVKGFKTEVFKLKHKLFEYFYPDLHLELI